LFFITRESGESCNGKVSFEISATALSDYSKKFPISSAKYQKTSPTTRESELLPPAQFGVRDCRLPGCSDKESVRFQEFMMWREASIRSDIQASRNITNSILNRQKPKQDDISRIKCFPAYKDELAETLDFLVPSIGVGPSGVECKVIR
jgi:hypothetical protein